MKVNTCHLEYYKCIVLQVARLVIYLLCLIDSGVNYSTT